jgi:hypothetical protein
VSVDEQEYAFLGFERGTSLGQEFLEGFSDLDEDVQEFLVLAGLDSE